jgi:hypothetical protein
MEEVEGKEVTRVYEAYTIYDDLERDARRPESDLPWADPPRPDFWIRKDMEE